MTSESTFDTLRLHGYLDRFQKGDQDAADALLRATCGRLENLARKMLKGFPNVKRWADTDDVLQNASMRLLRSLQTLRPATTRDFVNLAATNIRRELLDLARHFRNRCGPDPKVGPKVGDPGGTADSDLDLWADFHEQVDLLPIEEREVVALTFYHGWTQAEIAELFHVDERTIRRRWRGACVRLSDALGGRSPFLGPGGPARL
jgi:RNA polymerase sigma-70 factor (ECF subfamily)